MYDNRQSTVVPYQVSVHEIPKQLEAAIKGSSADGVYASHGKPSSHLRRLYQPGGHLISLYLIPE